jgi:cytochrome P450
VIETSPYFPNTDAFVDLTSHDAYTAGTPHATYARMRRESPVCWIDEAEGCGFWAVTTYREIVDVSRLFDTYTSRQGIRLEEMTAAETESRRTLMEMDPPEHTRLRRLVSKVFTRRIVEEYERQIRALAVEVVDAAIGRDEFDVAFDIVIDVAKQLPMRMLGALMGTPDADGDHLVELGDALLGNTDPEFTDHVVDQVDTDEFRMMPFRSPAGHELFDYAKRQAHLRYDAHDGSPLHDDVIAKLLAPTTDGEPLTEREFQNFFTLMVAAGNDTTRYSMAGMFMAMIEQPAAFEALRDLPDDHEAWRSATEEVLRWTAVTTHFRRTATCDVELRGQQIRTGDKVVVYYPSGNFDDAQFASPFTLDLGRSPNDHLTFGRGGPHRCLGEWLARMELRVVLQEWMRRVATIEQAGEREYLRSNFISGIKHLPVRITRR